MEQAYAANMQLPKLGLVLFTFGNASAADRDNKVFAIKPRGVPYEQLSPENMVIVDFVGNTVEGKLNPSSDTKTHAVLYKTLGKYRRYRAYTFHLWNCMGKNPAA